MQNTKQNTQQVMRGVMSWMEEEEILERKQMQADEQKRYEEDSMVPNWLWPDEDPSDIIYQ